MSLPDPQDPVELALIQIVLEAFDLEADHAGSIVPDDVEDHLPYFCITRIGGPRGRLIDYPTIDLDVYHDSFGQARIAADTVDELFSGMKRIRSVVVDSKKRVIDECFCNKQPSRMPWDGSEGRYGAIYAFTLRRR